MTSKREDGTLPSVRPATRFVTGGRDPFAQHGYVNPPVYHASTLLYRSAEDYLAHRSRYQYGRRGTPTSEALSDAIAELEGPSCAGVALLPSGLAACSIALMAMLKAGDHVLVTDNVYQPTRIFCDGNLSRQGVSTTYYDPLIGSDIASLFTPSTRAVYLESPGSLSFEIPGQARSISRHSKRASIS
jgi:cystathionine beta-lyase